MACIPVGELERRHSRQRETPVPTVRNPRLRTAVVVAAAAAAVVAVAVDDTTVAEQR
eukprot:COSAG05_NODE_3234_length_2218_cov_1.479000_2_plen_57_part_00